MVLGVPRAGGDVARGFRDRPAIPRRIVSVLRDAESNSDFSSRFAASYVEVATPSIRFSTDRRQTVSSKHPTQPPVVVR